MISVMRIRDPKSGIRDGEKSGSGINIPDTQHCMEHKPMIRDKVLSGDEHTGEDKKKTRIN